MIAYNSTSFTIYDSNGNSILTKKLVIESFSENNTYFIVSKDGYKGVYKFDGTLIVPVEFDKIFFDDNEIVVIKNSLYGAYSYDGNIIVPVEFIDIYFPEAGIIEVKKEKNGPYEVYTPKN